jgi:ABC-type uncharacterized transport system auxiliary subunit
MNPIRLLVPLALAAILSGCAATQKMSDADRAAFKSASVVAEPADKEKMFLLAPGGQNIGLMFGAIGGLAASGAIEDNRQAFAAFLEKNNISIDRIVREEVEKAFRESGKLTLVGPGQGAPAKLKISVPQYGFGVTTLLSSKVVPTLWIKCDLVDASGRLLWSENERMLPSVANPMESTTWKEMADNPAKVEDDWRKAAAYLAKKIVGEL